MAGSPGARSAPAGRRRSGEGQGQGGRAGGRLDFEQARSELTLLLDTLDRDFWKHGLASGEAAAEPADVEAVAREARRRAALFAGAMARGLQARLRRIADACAALSEDERRNLADLLRLPEPRRRAVAALLRLPEQQRRALAALLGLSDDECGGLADFLRPRAEERPEPTLTIIDPAAREQDTEPLTPTGG